MDELYDLTYTGPQIQAILDEAHKLLEGIYATENWVTNQLSGLASQSWVTQQGYATQTWITQQGFATQTWVNQQGFATQSYVTSQLADYLPLSGGSLDGSLAIGDSNTSYTLTLNGQTVTPGGGTVTSVGLTMPTGFSVTNTPVTGSGTLTVALNTGCSLLTDGITTSSYSTQRRINFPSNTNAWFMGADGYYFDSDIFINNSSNKVLTGITSTMVTNALGYTPLDPVGITVSRSNSEYTIGFAKNGTTKRDVYFTNGAQYAFDANVYINEAAYIVSGTDVYQVATQNDLASYLPLSGGTLTGKLTIGASNNKVGMQLFGALNIDSATGASSKIYWGDGSYVWVGEDSDDHLGIYADKGMGLTVGNSYSTTIIVGTNTIMTVNSSGVAIGNSNSNCTLTLNGQSITPGGGGTGTVTSVGLTMPTGFSVTNTPVTGSGTLTVAFDTGYSMLTDGITTSSNSTQRRINFPSNTNAWFMGADGYYFDSDVFINNTNGRLVKASELSSYLPLAGGTLTGKLTIGAANNKVGMQLYGPLNIDSAAGASSKIYWGDGSYVWVGEDSDDHLGIYGSHGIGMSVGSSYNTTIAVGTNTILTVNSSGVSIGNSNSNLSLTLNGQTITPGGGGISMTDVWNGLAGATNEQINASHLSTALSGYTKDNDLGDLAWLDDIATNHVTALTSYSKGSSTAALETSDTLNQALSKLECKADTSAKRIGQYQGYGTCTGSSTTSGATRNVTLEGYDFQDNGVIVVKFTYANGANMKLSVNGKTAKNVRYNGANITAGTITAGETVTLVYADTYYNLIKTTTTYYAGTLLAIGYDGKNYSILSSLETSFLMPSSLSGYATETWADNKFLQLSGGTVEGNVYIGALNSNKDLTVYGNIQTSYCKLNNSESNPFLKLSHKYNNVSSTWYVQASQGVLGIGMGIANSVKIDGSGNIDMISGSHIQFNYTYGSNNYWSQINTSSDGLQIEGTPNQKYTLDVNGHIHTTSNLYVDGYLYFDTNVYIYWSSGHLYLKNGSAAAQIIV